ncbi:MAG: hypothetical protein HZA18_06480 [Nitrospirae bacterium]|nr:hypothetical protein [Nitrospirota bacterium]
MTTIFVCKRPKSDPHVRRELLDLATEIWLETGIKISPLIFSSEEFETLSWSKSSRK